MFLNLRNTLALFAFCAVFYFASTGCKKTVDEKFTYVIFRDTTVIVDSTLDKTIVLNLWQNSGIDGVDTATSYLALFKFNKNDYLGVDSIVFSANPSVEDTTNYSIVSLYDLTDNVVIAGSTLSSNQYIFQNSAASPAAQFLQTGNLYNALPSKEILLGASIKGTRIATPSAGYLAFASFAYLYLYRK